MSNITLTIPNDDHIALRAFGKALEEMALAHGAEPRKTVGELSYKLNIDTSEATAAAEEMQQVVPQMVNEPEIDTTPQQVESLAAPMGDDEEQAPSTTDSTGTPWDERIHSTSKVLNADGTWRLRRKPKDMDETEWAAFVESVKGELHTQTPVMTDEEVKTLEPVEIGEPTQEEVDEASNKMIEPPVTPPGDDFHTDAGVLTEQTVVGIPPIPVPPPVVVAPPVPGVTEWDFPRLMTFLTERHGKIDVATVNTLLAQDGISSVQELNAHPDKIGPFVARVKAHLGE
ncbi:hypothetical protein PQZ62_gp39 [Klebsiella phage MEW1]|uniref:Uncharacterized protein n=1 Tax=Klebsiella phage MEW1 TaxID=2776813 RepID=A0A7M1IDP5_9CAUD|nr:hypothetical protein PQZ62_gp39 [Klebsiella phage MEW1]QOQ37696.1 hypothetical protein MEW1_39 [Klebsiella phage MEW1]